MEENWKKVGRKQKKVGGKQKKVGRKQKKVGRKQKLEKIGRKSAEVCRLLMKSVDFDDDEVSILQ